jgi:predicted transposase YdaD
LYRQQHGVFMPVISVVIWIDDDGRPPNPIYSVQVGDQLIAQWHYHEIQLYTMNVDTSDVTYLVLAPLLQNTKPDQLEMLATKLYQESPEPYRVILLSAFLQLAEAEFGNIEEIKQSILRKWGITMAQFKDFVAQSPIGIEIREEAKAEGKREGKLEGQLEGQRTAITMVWTARFGEPTEDVKIALLAATPEILANLTKHIALVVSLDEARTLLNL